jgi:hypothetical protein
MKHGSPLEQETCEKLFNCMADSAVPTPYPTRIQRLSAESERHAKATISQSLEANNQHFNEAREKLEKWADDLVLGGRKGFERHQGANQADLQRQAQIGHQSG